MPRVSTLTVTRDDLIKAILRKLEVIGEGELPSTEDYANCAFGLNLMLKAWEKDGFYLWKTTEIQVPLVSGNNTYQIGDTATGTGAIVTNRPIRIMNDACFIRDANNNDTPITVLSRSEYDNLSAKLTSGVTNLIYYDPQLTNGILKTYPTPNSSDRTVFLVSQIPIYDFTTGSETLDMPQEGYQAVVYGGADEMQLEYPGLSPQKMQIISSRAEAYKNQLADWSQEETSTYFSPSFRR